MPTYEYRCPEGHEFERFYRKISDAAAELPCPECGKVAVRKLTGGAGLVFKGSGFYLTDYGKNAHRGGPPERSGSGDKSGESKGGESKGTESKGTESKGTESKPAESKSESKSSDSSSSSSTSSSTSGSNSKLDK